MTGFDQSRLTPEVFGAVSARLALQADEAGTSSRLFEVLGALNGDDAKALAADGDSLTALVEVCCASPFLVRMMATRPEWTRDLFLEGDWSRSTDRAELRRVLGEDYIEDDEAAFFSRLRDLSRREMIRIVARYLNGAADLMEVTSSLSDVAEVCLSAAIDWGFRRLTSVHGMPPGLDSDRTGFVVVGMGKLGSRELNLSSDVDLIYLYDAPEGGVGAMTDGPTPSPVAQFYDRLGRLVTRSLSELTADGLVFRVDLDLRPGGKDGALVQTLTEAESHYLYHGLPWERLALLRARPVAGDLVLGKSFIDSVRPFVIRRSLDFTALEEIRDLKRRFAARNGAGRTHSGTNLKLDGGGIRQVEFFVQTLQVIYAGRMPELWVPDTIGGLGALADSGIVDPGTAGELSEAYGFLRTVEHRLQMVHFRQTHSLPTSEAELRDLAVGLGFRGAECAKEFFSVLDGHRRLVAGHFDRLLSEPEEGDKAPSALEPDLSQMPAEELTATLGRWGYSRPDESGTRLTRLLADRVLMTPDDQRRGVVRSVVSRLSAQLADSPDPDQGLTRAERYLEAVGRRTSLYVLLFENPEVLRLLSRVFGASELLSGLLVRNPSLLDGLIDPRLARPVRAKRDMAAELGTVLSAGTDVEDQMGLLRRFLNDERLRIGVYDLIGQLSLSRVSTQVTHLAEVVLEQAIAMAREMLVSSGRYCPKVSIMGLGKLGGGEMSLTSDLDVIFVCRETDPAAMEGAVRLSQRLISILRLPLPEGPGLELDARLRPSGTFGPLVVSLESFKHYHRTSEPWERQALTKIRVVAGDRVLGREVVAAAHEVVYGGEPGVMPVDLADRMHGLRRRMFLERAGGRTDRINLKLGWGGIVDVEFVVQFLQMVTGYRHPGVRTPHTRRAIRALVTAGELGRSEGRTLERAYLFLRRLDGRLRLISGRSGDEAGCEGRDIALASLSGGDLADCDGVKVERVMAEVRQIYGRVLGFDPSAEAGG